MSAAAALARAEAAGVRLRLGGDGGGHLEAAGPPPPEVLTELRRCREDVVLLLATRAALIKVLPVPDAPARPLGPAPRPALDWRGLPYGPERGVAFAIARREPGACPCCAGRRWWEGEGAQAARRCTACHPPPPGLAFREVRT